MKLKFKQQQYQIDAAGAVVDCFRGEVNDERQDILHRYAKVTDAGTLFEKKENVTEYSFGNHGITISPLQMRENITAVQGRNNIDATKTADMNQFSIEMETGTGKTYTYIKTMYELNKNYGWSKFIVVTPSIAIREGVQKSFEDTAEHFQELYGKKIRFFIYNSNNSSNIANISSFASDNNIQVMIINYQAFNAKSAANRKIYEELDELQSDAPINVIKSVNPIIIVDEPQKMGDNTEDKLLKEFNPLFILRYSATHRKGKEYNKVYRLDALDSYNQKLVKRINVRGIELVNNKSESTYLYLDHVDISKTAAPVAYIEIEVKTTNGIKKKMMKFERGDDLFQRSNENPSYRGYKIADIDATNNSYDRVEFTNGEEIKSGELVGDTDASYIARLQIRDTIKAHLEKERVLFHYGIKVLSLFFIDEVAKYREYGEDGEALAGEYAKVFEEEYNNALAEARTFLDQDYLQYLDNIGASETHDGYFSVDKKGRMINSADKKGEGSEDVTAYDLIMKRKDLLLSFDTPIRFIFSHSALREGWDNPNIFQICTLKHSNSEISKRQEIGRGLRICVNKNGDRQDFSVLEGDFHNINTLTVIANESYDSFASSLQSEIAAALTTRKKKFDLFDFVNKEFTNDDGLEDESGNKTTKVTQVAATKLLSTFIENGYIEATSAGDYSVTQKLKDAIEDGEVKLPEDFDNCKKAAFNLVAKLYGPVDYKIHDDRQKTSTLTPNENFYKDEFQKLWEKINHKSVYRVDFDTEALIRNSIEQINANLHVSQMRVRRTSGTQNATMSESEVRTGTSMTGGESKTVVAEEEFTPSMKTYDLVGEICKSIERGGTGLTRKTVVRILKGLDRSKLVMFGYDPDEFIASVVKIINNVKAVSIVDGITYHKIEDKFDNDIFTLASLNTDSDRVFPVKKNIHDFVQVDSTNEKKFAEAMESGAEITVYAKLPTKFKIPTPLGTYNPDWAIVFDNDNKKNVYFIAETKHTSDEDKAVDLRPREDGKIECARKHFASLIESDITYDVIHGYEDLMNKILNK